MTNPGAVDGFLLVQQLVVNRLDRVALLARRGQVRLEDGVDHRFVKADEPPTNTSGAAREFRARPHAPERARPAPFLTQHTALVLLAAIVIGLVVGALTFLNGTPAPGAVLAGLLAVGAGIPVLRALIG